MCGIKSLQTGPGRIVLAIFHGFDDQFTNCRVNMERLNCREFEEILTQLYSMQCDSTMMQLQNDQALP